MSYSSKTINREATSRNQHHLATFGKIKELLGSRPLVLDREFSYLELLENLVLEGVNFVIRLKTDAYLYDGAGNLVELSVPQGKTRLINQVFYMGRVCVNVIGVWKIGFSNPMWIMTNMTALVGLTYYFERMKIEEAFLDLTSLLNFQKFMNEQRSQMETGLYSCSSLMSWLWSWERHYGNNYFLRNTGNTVCIPVRSFSSNSNLIFPLTK